MPTVLRVGGLRFVIWSHDHDPAHVHVYVGGGLVVVKLGGRGRKPETRENIGASGADERRALRITSEHQAFLLSKWEEIHGQK